MAGRKHEIPISFFANFSYHVSNFKLNAASKSFCPIMIPDQEKCLKEFARNEDKIGFSTLQIYTAGIGTHVKSVKVTSICHRYYNVKV